LGTDTKGQIETLVADFGPTRGPTPMRDNPALPR
jgi:hypothetical protein